MSADWGARFENHPFNLWVRGTCEGHALTPGHHVTCAACARVCCRWWLEMETEAEVGWVCPMCMAGQSVV